MTKVIPDTIVWAPKKLCPFSYTFTSYDNVSTLVTILLFVGRPSAISRAIVSTVVDSIYRQFIGIAISQCPESELLKTLSPPPAHPNAAFSIEPVTLIVYVVATT